MARQVDDELERAGVYPGRPGRFVGEVEIPSEEYEEMSADIGRRLLEKLYRLINSEGYDRLSPEKKAKLLRNRIREARERGRKPYRKKYR